MNKLFRIRWPNAYDVSSFVEETKTNLTHKLSCLWCCCSWTQALHFDITKYLEWKSRKIVARQPNQVAKPITFIHKFFVVVAVVVVVVTWKMFQPSFLNGLKQPVVVVLSHKYHGSSGVQFQIMSQSNKMPFYVRRMLVNSRDKKRFRFVSFVVSIVYLLRLCIRSHHYAYLACGVHMAYVCLEIGLCPRYWNFRFILKAKTHIRKHQPWYVIWKSLRERYCAYSVRLAWSLFLVVAGNDALYTTVAVQNISI